MSERENVCGSFAPLLLVLFTLALWFGFQTTQLLKEREESEHPAQQSDDDLTTPQRKDAHAARRCHRRRDGAA